MKDSFPTMRLWTASLLTLGAVLIQCPAQAQSIGPLKETYDQGKTWQREGTGRPNRGSRGGNSTPSVSPEEAARQQAQAEERRRQDVGDKANQEGLEYYKQGNWDAAVQAFEKALRNWDSEIIRNNLAHAKKQVRLQRERIEEFEKGKREALKLLKDVDSGEFDLKGYDKGNDFTFKEIGDSSNQDSSVVDLRHLDPNKPITVDPARVKGAAATSVPQQPGGGLDFITDPATVLSRPAVSNTREPNTDPNVVDLRDAKTLTVDPARVKGVATTPVPQQQSEKFSKAAGEALRDSLTAQQKGNPQAKAEADSRLQKLSQEELQQLAQWQAGAHQEMLDDMQMLQANGDKYVIALEEAKARVRAKELTALKAADEKYHKDSSEYLRRLMGNEIKMKPGEVNAIIERRRAEQSAAVERAYYKMAAEVQHLKRQLLAETNGLPIIPRSENSDMELLFSQPPPR